MKITAEHLEKATKFFKWDERGTLAICNKAIEIAQAEAEQPKPAPVVKKQISWSQIPQFVCVRNKDLLEFIFLGLSDGGDTVYVFNANHPNIAHQMLHNIELAPAADQPWIAVPDCFNFPRVPGVAYKLDMGRVKVIGIESGYVLGGN